MSERQFPIGPFQAPDPITPAHVAAWLAEIAEFPAQLRATLAALDPTLLERPYRPGGWTRRQVVQQVPLATALDFLDALHARWVTLLHALTPADLQREFVHPDSGPVELATNVGIYAWHGRHHLAHLTLPEFA